MSSVDEKREAFAGWLAELSAKSRWAWLADEEERQRVVDFVDTRLLDVINNGLGWDVTSAFDVPETSRWSQAGGQLLASDYTLDDATLGTVTRVFRLMDLFCQEQERARRPKTQQKRKSKTTASQTEPVDNMQPPQQQEDDSKLPEGAMRQVSLTRRERNPRARAACLRRYGYRCQACGFDFEAFYGNAGREFVEVHHLTPIASTEGEHEVDTAEGLVPLCSNCHSIIHRAGSDMLHPISLEQLKQLINANGRH